MEYTSTSLYRDIDLGHTFKINYLGDIAFF